MKRALVFACCIAIGSMAHQPASAAGAHTLQPALPPLLIRPAANANDMAIANFYITCAAAVAESNYAGAIQTGKDDPALMKGVKIYLAVGAAYSSEQFAMTKIQELKMASDTRIKSYGTGRTFDLDMALLLDRDLAQAHECGTYLTKHKEQAESRAHALHP